MSHPSESELDMLGRVSMELRERFAERGYKIGVAIDTDPAFGSGQTRGFLARDLAVDAVSECASQIGVDFRAINGSGREFRFFDGETFRHYRFRRAKPSVGGEFRVPAAPDSALAANDNDDDGLIPSEQWLYIWTMSDDGLIHDTVVAPIIGYIEGKPGLLQLGPAIRVGDNGEGSYVRDFVPDSDDFLDGFEEDEREDEAGDGLF